jgi:hypothetical protein
VQLQPLRPERESTVIEVKADNIQELPQIALKLSNASQQEFVFAEKFAKNMGLHINPFHYISGNLSALLTLKFKERALHSITGSQINGDNFFVVYKPWDVVLGSEKVLGKFSFDLDATDPYPSVNADLAIDKGQVIFNQWHFTHINTRLEIQNGQLQSSSAHVQLAGLKGKAVIPGGQSDVLMHLFLEGAADELIPFVPERMQKGIARALSQDTLTMQSTISKQKEAIAVISNIVLKNPADQKSDPLHFGFSIKKSRLPKCLLKLDLGHMLSEPISRHKGYAGFHIEGGWIKADNLALNQWIGPFIFPDNEAELTGQASLEGSFDSARLMLRYCADDLVLRNEDLIFEVPHIGSAIDPKPGYHVVNFRTGEHFGHIPIANGSYFEKNSGLLFANVDSKIIFEGKKLHADELTTFCNGMFFEGAVDLDYSSPLKGCYDISIFSKAIEGTFSEAQHILAHFEKPHFITKIPLEGTLNLSQEGGAFFMGVTPQGINFQARLGCSLSQGKLSCPPLDMEVHELSLNFLYDLDENILDISDMQGVFLHGKPEHLREYTLQSEIIHFYDFENHQGHFDISIEDDSQPFIRVVGKTESLEGQAISFIFDKTKTHFGKIYPETLELVVSECHRIEHLQLNTHFRLSNLLYMIQKVGRSRAHYINQDLMDSLNQLTTVSGELALAMNFKGADGIFGFDLQGKDIMIDERRIEEFHLNGTHNKGRFAIEQLTLDQISVSAEFMHIDNQWNVDFLGFRYGSDFLMGLSGIYRQGDPKIEAKINLLEGDLSKLQPFEPFTAFTLEGKLKAQGNLLFTKKPKGLSTFDVVLQSEVQGLKIQDLHLLDASSFEVHWESNRGVTLSNFKGGVAALDGPQTLNFDIKDIDYDFESERLTLSEMPFSIPSQHLSWLSDRLKQYFPDQINEKTADAMGKIKSDGPLKGYLQASIGPSYDSFRLNLENGSYNIFGHAYDLKECTINKSAEECTITALTDYNSYPIWVLTCLHAANASQGETILMDGKLDALEEAPMVIHWRQTPEEDLMIDTVKGSLGGLSVNLMQNPHRSSNANTLQLTGIVTFDGHQTRQLMPPHILQAFERLQIGSGYKVQGAFEFAREDHAVRFFGNLSGADVQLGGYRFKNIRSQIILEPHCLRLVDLNLSDPAGAMHIANLKVQQQADQLWRLSIPLITAYEFRPSLLYEDSLPPPNKRKPLLVKQFYVQNLTGILGHSDSFLGQGSLDFVNPQRKNLKNTIFAIPVEILTRIGLNLSVLTPVSGTIDFTIRNSKIYLTKFKDVYSENKISRFYLPPQGIFSTIDFDGNMDVQVRFKQSTLLLKLVELFTVNINGTLKNPIYSLQHQKYFRNQKVYTSTDEQEIEAL